MTDSSSIPIDAIGPFTGEWRWLSNFWPVEVIFEGETYPTVEHAYQAAKTTDPELRAQIRLAPSPGKAKALGSILVCRIEFEEIREVVMLDLLRQKFADEALGRKLMATGSREIMEVNRWGDTYWGVCEGVGENRLGKLLERVRRGLQGGTYFRL